MPSDTTTFVISCTAIAVSLLSLGVSVFNAWRDSAKLVITSKFSSADPDFGPAHLTIAMTNHGRRSVTVRLFGGTDRGGSSSAEYLGKDPSGLRLGEGDRHDKEVYKEDTILVSFDPNETLIAEHLWVEDSLGRRYEVPNSREHIRLLWAQASPTNEG